MFALGTEATSAFLPVSAILWRVSIQLLDGLVIPTMSWGDRLRLVRTDVARLDQRAFAESIGMKHGTYGGYETMRVNPRAARLVANSIELRWRVPAAWVLGELPHPDSNWKPADYPVRVLRGRPAGPHFIFNHLGESA